MSAKTSLTCTRCDTTIDKCTCPDMDESLKKVVFDPAGLMAVKWCRKCDKHFARCHCESPEFYIVLGGKETDMTQGVRNGLGQMVVPDLTAR